MTEIKATIIPEGYSAEKLEKLVEFNKKFLKGSIENIVETIKQKSKVSGVDSYMDMIVPLIVDDTFTGYRDYFISILPAELSQNFIDKERLFLKTTNGSLKLKTVEERHKKWIADGEKGIEATMSHVSIVYSFESSLLREQTAIAKAVEVSKKGKKKGKHKKVKAPITLEQKEQNRLLEQAKQKQSAENARIRKLGPIYVYSLGSQTNTTFKTEENNIVKNLKMLNTLPFQTV